MIALAVGFGVLALVGWVLVVLLGRERVAIDKRYMAEINDLRADHETEKAYADKAHHEATDILLARQATYVSSLKDGHRAEIDRIHFIHDAAQTSLREALKDNADSHQSQFSTLIAEQSRLMDRIQAPDAVRASLFPEMKPREYEDDTPPEPNLDELLELEIAGE